MVESPVRWGPSAKETLTYRKLYLAFLWEFPALCEKMKEAEAATEIPWDIKAG